MAGEGEVSEGLGTNKEQAIDSASSAGVTVSYPSTTNEEEDDEEDEEDEEVRVYLCARSERPEERLI